MSERVINLAESQRSPAAAERDPLVDLITRLSHEANQVADREPALAAAVRKLALDIADQPSRTQDRQTRVSSAYLLQDVEKLLGPINSVPQGLRQEMEHLATNMPGLKNERLRMMLATTPQIDDRDLTARIRRAAHSTAQLHGDQNGTEVAESLRSLEASFASATRGLGRASGPSQTNSTPEDGASVGARGNGTTEPKAGTQRTGSKETEAHAHMGGVSETKQPQSDARSRIPDQEGGDPLPDWTQGAQQRPPHGNVAGSPAQSAARGAGVLAQAAAGLVHGIRNDVGIISQALGALYKSEKPDDVLFKQSSTPMAERIRRHEEALQEQRDEKVIRSAQTSQQAALDAINAYANGPASNILTKIQDAAKSDPGGMQAVLSEMRAGGRYENLRSQFNADRTLERGMAAASDKVAATLQEFNAGREAVAKIGARNGTSAALNARFEQMDAEIGQATSMLPSRTDGKSVMDDLSDKVRELLQKAMSAVKSVFTPGAERNASASSGPSPS